jgi:DNA polymerase-1
MSKTKPKLIIIDGNALIHRSFHALPPTLRTKDGRLVNAVYGFTSFLLKALNEFRPEYVVLTLDKKGPTFRHEAYAAYKATRVKAPDELYEQIPLVKKVAAAFGIPILERDGYEADDLIGTICAQTQNEKKLERVIITGDLDTLQLVDDETKVYTMSRGLSDSLLYGPAEVRTRYQLEPGQMIDYKALRGDPSDNIPGVKGIGEKTAGELLADFKTLDGVYAAAAKRSRKIKERVLELLLTSQANAYLSKQLVTIDRQAPIKFRLADAIFSVARLDEILKVFSELEFKSLLVKVKELRDKINKTSDRQSAKAAETTDGTVKKDGGAATGSGAAKFARNEKDFDYQLVDDDKKFATFLKKLKQQKEFTMDTETSGLDPLTAELLGISFAWKKGAAYFVLITPERFRELKPIFADAKIKKYGHNLKFDWRVLTNQGAAVNGLAFDTMIASYLLNPSHRQHNLDALVFTELGFEKISKDNLAATQPQQLAIDFKSLDPAKLSLYSCEDADFTNRLVKILGPRLKKEGLDDVFHKIEMPLIPVLGAMENNGILLKIKPLAKLNDEVTVKLAGLEKDIYKRAGEKFNINSTKQLKEILFTKLAIPTESIKKTKTGFSTAEDELEKMRDLHPIIPLLQDYREFNKLQTTYLNALPELINKKTGRIHTSFNQTIAATGRLSSADPNLQNIPTRTAEGEKIRSAFVAAPGYRLAGFDYSQIELRLAADISGDKKMIKAFQDGEDIHTATAAEINGVAPAAVTKNMRREAKAVNFGIIYGQGPHGLSQGAGIPYWQAGEFIKKYFAAYPNIKKMMDNFIKKARANGYAVTLFGRKRPLPEINSTIPVIRKSAERMAINTPLQGTAADVIKIAMIKIGELLQGQADEARLLLQVHDELIFEIKKDKVETYAPKIQAIMQEVIKLRVPITADIKVGENWGELK